MTTGSRTGNVADVVPSPAGGDRILVASILGGDETAFGALADRYHEPMFRFALHLVPTRVMAEDVVQETWMGLLRSLDTFEWRCSLKTWLFTILVRTARRMREREGREVPVAEAYCEDLTGVSAESFFPPGHRWAGSWRVDRPEAQASGWQSVPEETVLAREACDVVARTMATLPAIQREVFVLRDVEGSSAEEACAMLDLNPNHQRVVLHRARLTVRAALDRYFATVEK